MFIVVGRINISLSTKPFGIYNRKLLSILFILLSIKKKSLSRKLFTRLYKYNRWLFKSVEANKRSNKEYKAL